MRNYTAVFNHKFRGRCLRHSVLFSVLRELWTPASAAEATENSNNSAGMSSATLFTTKLLFLLGSPLTCLSENAISNYREYILYTTTRSAAYRAWSRSPVPTSFLPGKFREFTDSFQQCSLAYDYYELLQVIITLFWYAV